MMRWAGFLGVCVCQVACVSVARERPAAVDLDWPEVVVPMGATAVTYEVRVWRADRGVPVEVVQSLRVAESRCTLPTSRWPRECVWSVRAHWRQGGVPRQSRWLDAGFAPVADAVMPATGLARL